MGSSASKTDQTTLIKDSRSNSKIKKSIFEDDSTEDPISNDYMGCVSEDSVYNERQHSHQTKYLDYQRVTVKDTNNGNNDLSSDDFSKLKDQLLHKQQDNINEAILFSEHSNIEQHESDDLSDPSPCLQNSLVIFQRESTIETAQSTHNASSISVEDTVDDSFSPFQDDISVKEYSPCLPNNLVILQHELTTDTSQNTHNANSISREDTGINRVSPFQHVLIKENSKEDNDCTDIENESIFTGSVNNNETYVKYDMFAYADKHSALDEKFTPGTNNNAEDIGNLGKNSNNLSVSPLPNSNDIQKKNSRNGHNNYIDNDHETEIDLYNEGNLDAYSVRENELCKVKTKKSNNNQTEIKSKSNVISGSISKKERKWPQSSALCLDNIDAKWEAFFINNVPHQAMRDDIQILDSACTQSIPPSSTEYRRRSTRKMRGRYTKQDGEEDEEDCQDVLLHEAKTYQDQTNKIVSSIALGNKDMFMSSAKENQHRVTDREPDDDATVVKLDADFERCKSKIGYKNREYNFDLAYKYLEALQITVKQKGYFKQFPTSKVLQKGQTVLQNSKMIPPKNEQGLSVPYPYLQSRKENNCFTHVDRIVTENLSISKNKDLPTLTKHIQEIVSHLKTDIQKSRAVYKLVIPPFEEYWQNWEIYQNLFNLKSSEICVDSLETFSNLCGYIGLSCVVIDGKRKDYMDGILQTTTWTAVLTEGKWRFVDPQLPFLFHLEQNIIHEEVLTKFQLKQYYKMVYDQLVDFYFVTDPTDLVQINLPSKTYWQLLCRTVNNEEWSKMVHIMPFFFIYGLCFVNFGGENINSGNQDVKVTLAYPKENQIVFSVTLCDIEKKNIVRAFTFVENDTENYSVNIYCKVPKSGSYILKVYCRDISIPFYVCVCNISIRFKFETAKKYELFPTGLRQQWGPGHDTSTAGLIAISHKKALINVDGEVEMIRFKLKFSLGLSCHLLNEQGDSCEKNILYWIDERIVNILITSPGEGTYTFFIFSSDGKNFNPGIPTCSYVLNFKTAPSKRFKTFDLPNRRLGLTDIGRQQKCMLLSKQSDFIHTSESGTLELKFKFSNSAACFPQLRLNGESVSEDMNSHIAWFCHNGHMSCTINLPKQGDYLLSLSSKCDNGASVLYYAVFHVQVPSANWASFPKRLMQHTETTVRILEPHSGVLPAKTEIYFKVELACECDVAIVTSKGWFHLDQTEGNYWEGSITSGAKGTEVKMVARFEIGSDVFTPLLIYKVITDEEIEKRSTHQQKLREEALKCYIKPTGGE